MDIRKHAVSATALLAILFSGLSSSLYAIDYTFVEGRFLLDAEMDADWLDDDNDTCFTLGGDYYFMPNASAGIELDMGGDYGGLSIGAKYYF